MAPGLSLPSPACVQIFLQPDLAVISGPTAPDRGMALYTQVDP